MDCFDQAGLDAIMAALGVGLIMKRVVALLMFGILAGSLVGCSGQGGTDAERAQNTADMEKRVNSQALKDNPPPPGEGPSN